MRAISLKNITGSVIAILFLFFAPTPFTLGIQQKTQYHRLTVSDETFGLAQAICKKRGWKWEEVRTHGFFGSIAVFRPYPEGGEERFTLDGKTGRVSSEYKIFSFNNDIKNSATLKYYDDGTLAAQIPYTNDIPHGTAKYYDKNGKLQKKIIYENGKPIQ